MAPIKHILFFVLLPFTQLFGQTMELGVPFCENITPTEIGYGGENYSISQDIMGIMFFGNENGIITYDALNWELRKFQGKPIIYRDKLGKIYVGGYNIIEEFNTNENGKISSKSILDGSLSFGQIEKINSFRNQIYFIANNTLYKVSDRKLTEIISDEEYLNFFIERDALYISNSENLYTYDNGKITVFEDSLSFKNNKILDIFRYSDNLIIRTTKSFHTITRDYEVEEFKTQIDHVISRFGYACSQSLSDNTLCIGTKGMGLFFINSDGKLLNYLNTETGLNDNTICDLFIDKSNNLWIAYSNGIGRVEVPSAFTYFNKNHGLAGKVNSLVRHNDYIYVGTNKGVFKLVKSANSAKSFEKISPVSMSCKKLVSSRGYLYAATEEGLYLIDNNEFTLLQKGNIQTFAIECKSNIIWACTKTRVYKLEMQAKESKLIKSFSSVEGEIGTIVCENNTIWIGTRFNGIYRIKNDKIVNIETTGLPDAVQWVEVYKTTPGVLFSTEEGLFRFDSEIEMFYSDSKIKIPAECADSRISPIVEDEEKNLWLSFQEKGEYENQISVAWSSQNIDRYTLITTQFNKLRNHICSDIYPDSNSVVWFGGFEGLVRLDFKMLNPKRNPKQTILHKVIIGTDSVLSDITQDRIEFSYKYNSVRFEFATPIYENRKEVTYTHILEGYENEWAKADKIKFKEYSSLPAGKYTFKVKSYDVNGNVSSEASFDFAVSQHPFFSWWAILIYILLLLSMITIVMRYRAFQFVKEKAKLSSIIQDRTEELLLEKEKTENLLRNILPEDTAQELKEKGRATSMRFNMATILFSDIQGFTKIAEKMSPDKLIDELDRFFLEFDKIVEKHNIEKIKTIGDAYMCAGGIPQKNRTNPIEVVVAALEMQYRTRQLQREQNLIQEDFWGLRIGIHTGPIIAGVVGSKKFSYDIWGDSVNIASRMESSGDVGKVNISESTYLLVQDFFDCEYRGKMPVKYKGEVDMYFVKGFKVQFSEDPLRIIPNEKFDYKFSLQKFEDLQELIFDRLQNELPSNLYYHNLKHTIDVIVQTEIIAMEEGVSDKDLFLLKTAALFHDSGFLLGYDEHEDMSQQLARNILPKYKYDCQQIETICDLIAVTKLPHNPKNLLQEIMCDADLDYVGRNDYMPVSRNLYRELLEIGQIKKSEQEWNKMQIKFLQMHKFFTKSSKTRRNVSKNKQIEKLQEQTKSFKISK